MYLVGIHLLSFLKSYYVQFLLSTQKTGLFSMTSKNWKLFLIVKTQTVPKFVFFPPRKTTTPNHFFKKRFICHKIFSENNYNNIQRFSQKKLSLHNGSVALIWDFQKCDFWQCNSQKCKKTKICSKVSGWSKNHFWWRSENHTFGKKSPKITLHFKV